MHSTIFISEHYNIIQSKLLVSLQIVTSFTFVTRNFKYKQQHSLNLSTIEGMNTNKTARGEKLYHTNTRGVSNSKQSQDFLSYEFTP